jgi:glycosyltransferase involved in cell wall biosynthesis
LIEILLVDDGSTDNTHEVVKNYSKNIDIYTKIFHEGWHGLGASRNMIVKNAKGKYVIWVDCDERLFQGFIEKEVDYMEKNPKTGICLGLLVMPKSNLLVKLDLLPFLIDRLKFIEDGTPLKRPATGGAIFRVNALRQVGGFDEKIKGAGEDVDVAYRIKGKGWALGATRARFSEGKGNIRNYRQLWKKHFWYGYGNHAVYLKNRNAVNQIRMNPLAGILAGILYAVDAYRLAGQKSFFFSLPVNYALKYTAWSFGFSRSHIRMIRQGRAI